MEHIDFKDWRLIASVIDTELLRLDVEAVDGSDIIEVGYGGHTSGRDGDPYALRFTTQKIEERSARGSGYGRRRDAADAEADDNSVGWPADEDETIYLRGWEVEAIVDEEGILSVSVERGDSDIFAVEPVESDTPLSPHVSVRLAAEESDDDEEDDDEDDDEDTDEDYEEIEELGELDDEYGTDEYDVEEEEDDSRMDDMYGSDADY